MANISQIPENINKYAIEWARKICTEPIENAKGLDFWQGKITEESDIFSGQKSTVNYDFKFDPKDIFVHNHPQGTPLSIDDINAAVRSKIKKIFASTKDGYTALDLTPIEESPEISRNTMEFWTMDAVENQNNFFTEFQKKVINENISREDGTKIVTEYLLGKINDFCKWTGAIFENIKWSDLK